MESASSQPLFGEEHKHRNVLGFFGGDRDDKSEFGFDMNIILHTVVS